MRLVLVGFGLYLRFNSPLFELGDSTRRVSPPSQQIASFFLQNLRAKKCCQSQQCDKINIVGEKTQRAFEQLPNQTGLGLSPFAQYCDRTQGKDALSDLPAQ